MEKKQAISQIPVNAHGCGKAVITQYCNVIVEPNELNFSGKKTTAEIVCQSTGREENIVWKSFRAF